MVSFSQAKVGRTGYAAAGIAKTAGDLSTEAGNGPELESEQCQPV